MKKYLMFVMLIVFSCQPDELMVVTPLPQYEMIFEESESSVTDGQEFSFQIIRDIYFSEYFKSVSKLHLLQLNNVNHP